ncbi:hypothetical protein Geob_2810 [Geotalea daltonii FRC-32]|uniref:Uncharacterized protein n=1 Tax=Geotalea daltonii (strain DSM 22248 / JCM 15807 / FRC-32) TaxID=316067 RepID=B9M241_GEODF|nr:hypothetical protein [Geotalea daltonii]ACM21159.1 hypothetical protein Geob_2810 [Geotalea daltonii FRC-32]
MEQKFGPENTATTPQSTKTKLDWKDYASILALAIALMTGLLSYYGRTYCDGYNSYWGLSEDMFSLSKEQSVINGVIAYLLVFVNVLMDYVVTLFYLVTALILLAMVCCLRRVRQKLEKLAQMFVEWLKPKASEHFHFSDTIERIINRLYLLILTVAASVLMVLVVAKTSQWASEQGKAIAKQNYKEILSGKPSTKPFTSRATLLVTNPSKSFDTYSGHLIQTSATHCALYQKGRGVLIFPLANIARMEIAENNACAKGKIKLP